MRGICGDVDDYMVFSMLDVVLCYLVFEKYSGKIKSDYHWCKCTKGGKYKLKTYSAKNYETIDSQVSSSLFFVQFSWYLYLCKFKLHIQNWRDTIVTELLCLLALKIMRTNNNSITCTIVGTCSYQLMAKKQEGRIHSHSPMSLLHVFYFFLKRTIALNC